MTIKVGVLTYHRHDNYGAVLQCYALQKVLTDMEADTYILDYFCKRDMCPYTLEALQTRGVVACAKGVAGILMRIPRRKVFQEFRSEFRLSARYTRSSIQNLTDEFDKFIVGSDNVWNAQITGFDTTYFLDFVKDMDKCNSYAASMGTGEIPEGLKKEYQDLLMRFKTISVREEETAKRIEAITGKNVATVLDPTMLLNTDKWKPIIRAPLIKEPYILVYQMLPNPKLIQFAKSQALKYKMRLIVISFARSCVITEDGKKEQIGPRQWIGLIQNAEYVVTDSFHGCAFSILFHKKFAVQISQLGCRIKNLTTLLGLQDRIIPDNYQFNLSSEIQFEKVEEILARQRNYSLMTLQKIIQN